MKKHFNTYGYVFLYLGFTFGLDRIYAFILMSYGENININAEYALLNLYWILFAIVSFIFLRNSIIKINDDKAFFNFQTVLGIYGAFYPVLSRNRYSLNFPYDHMVLVFIHGSQLGIFPVAFIFIGGLGVMGLIRIKKEN